VAGAAQARIDQADGLEQLRPVDVGNQPHAGDDVAHGDVRGALALLRVLDRLVDREPLLRQAVLEPAQRRHGPRILAAQALGELCGNTLRQRSAQPVRHPVARRGRCEHRVGDRVGLGACTPPGGSA